MGAYIQPGYITATNKVEKVIFHQLYHSDSQVIIDLNICLSRSQDRMKDEIKELLDQHGIDDLNQGFLK